MRTLLPALGAAVVLLSPAASAGAQQRTLDPARLAARADSFALQAGGQTIGTQAVTLDRTDAGFVFRETTVTPAASQATEVHLAPGLALRSVLQLGQVRGDSTRIEVTVADGRATGRARVPSPAGINELVVDAALPDGAVDDNTLIALIPALPWGRDTVFQVPVFGSGKNAVSVYTFRVTGAERVATPAGEVNALRAEVRGGQRPLVMYVDADAPHRLARMEIVGTPVVIVRTGR